MHAAAPIFFALFVLPEILKRRARIELNRAKPRLRAQRSEYLDRVDTICGKYDTTKFRFEEYATKKINETLLTVIKDGCFYYKGQKYNVKKVGEL